MELHSILRLSEMSVANFGTPDKCFVIQTQPVARRKRVRSTGRAAEQASPQTAEPVPLGSRSSVLNMYLSNLLMT